MERGVENGDVRQIRQSASRLVQRREGRWVVERGELAQLREGRLDLLVDDDGLAETRTSVHDPVRDCRNLGRDPLE